MTKEARLYGSSLYELASDEGLSDELMQQEWFPYAALTALALFVLWLIIHPRKKQKPKCACCESGGSVIGGVRMSSTDLWVKEAKYCPFCGRKLKP